MSVKHIDFLKIKPSKLLVVEIRPIRCVIETPSGPTRTAKWMNHNHWKELRGLLNDIADVYEEQRNSMKATQNVECNKPHIKIGSTLKIGYMFTTFRKCSCHYLTPRDNNVWTDDEDDSGKELKDKGRMTVACHDVNLGEAISVRPVPNHVNLQRSLILRKELDYTVECRLIQPAQSGRYDSFVPCGEMLVVSVMLLESSALCEQGLRDRAIGNHYDGGNDDWARSKMSPIRSDRQLVKALDSSIVFTNTISDYFEASQSLSTDSSISDQVCTRTSEDSRSKRQKTLKNMVSKSRSTTKKRKKKLSTAMQSSFENENPNRRQVLKSIFDTQSDGSSEACKENPFTVSRESKYPLENFNQNETKASYLNKLSYCVRGVTCTDNQILTDDLQSQKKKIDIQKESNEYELPELTASNGMMNVSYNDDKMSNLKKSSPNKREESTLTTSKYLEGNYEVEYELTHSSENEFDQSENELCFTSSCIITRSYAHFSNFKDQSTKLQDSKIACSAAKNKKDSNIGKLKPHSISSPAISPVLEISRSQVTKHSSDSSLFHPQVGDQREEETEAKDLGTQDHTQRAYRREEEETHSDMSEGLPDLKQLSPVLEVKIPLEHIDNRLSQHGVIQNRPENPKSSTEMKSLKRVVEAKNKKEKKIGMLFGDLDITEHKAEIKLLDSEQKMTQQSMLDQYIEEHYIPEYVGPKCKKDQNDFSSSFVPEYNPSSTMVSQYYEENYEILDDVALGVRRSSRIKEKGNSSSSRKESLSEKSTFYSSVSLSPSVESGVASLLRMKPSKLEDKSKGASREDISPKKCEVKNKDISLKKFKVKNKKYKVRKKDISPKTCKVRKRKFSSKNCKSVKTHLSEETLKSMKDLEKCRKVIEQLEKQSVSTTVQSEITNDFSEENGRCINIEKPKVKGKMLSVPQNQPKVADWISSRQNGKKNCQTFTKNSSKSTSSKTCVTDSKHKYCKRNMLLRQKSFGEESENKKKSNFRFGAKNSRNRIRKASYTDDISRTGELTCCTAAHLTLSQEMNIYDALNNQKDHKHSEENDVSDSGTSETQYSNSAVQGRKFNLVHTEMNAANLGEDTIMLPSKEDSLEDKASVSVNNKEYSKDPSLKSLIHSYKRLQQMTIEELESRLKQAIPYLRRVAKGQEPSKRHQVFKKGGREMQQMSDELIYGPYTEDQITCVVDMLSKNFLTVQDHDNQYKWRQYIWKVLAPTLLIKIVMDNEEITQDSAEKLLIEFSLNRKIRGSDNSSPI